jgi:hypothetical protein
MPRHDVLPIRITARAALVLFAATAVAFGLTALMAPPVAWAGVNLTRLEFAQQSVKLSQQSFVSGMGLRAHLAGGDLNDGLIIVPAIEYWKDTDRIPDLGVVELMQRDWRIGGDLRYRLGSGTGWRPYAGAGLGLHLTKARATVQTPATPEVTESESGNKLAPNFLVGVDLPSFGPIRNAIELNWHLVPDLKQFKINFGLGWEFGGDEGEGADEDRVY